MRDSHDGERPVVTMGSLLVAATLVVLGTAAAGPGDPAHGRVAEAMATEGKRFLVALRAEQRARASLSFTDEERFDWHFVPRPRRGIPLGDLDPAQRKAADRLLKTGLSARGYEKATSILALESVLGDLEGGRGSRRDPGLYFFSVFGAPGKEQPWGWRVEGHHLSLNFTVVGDAGIATSPAFFGAHPAEVRGRRPLAEEEDRARALLRSLAPAQRRLAIFEDVAPREIVTGSRRKAGPLPDVGIPAARLDPGQRRLLEQLLDAYLSRMPAELAADRLQKLRAAGFERIHFAWAGGSERGQPHYYRLQGPTFLVEYDNTQDDANHIHTVWRDFEGDFGADLLRLHYQQAPHPA